MNQQVTILIPHYKTLKLTKLCLRLLRKYTDLSKAKVVVIDNDSQDESSEYLKTVKWITLLTRKSIPGEDGATAHARALDLALDEVDTPYVLSIHTDTLVKRHDWLEFLLHEINKHPNIAGIGSWKLENKNWLERAAKKVEFNFQRVYYKLIGKKDHRLQGLDHNHYYLRSHCALYDMRIMKKHGLRFGTKETVGKRIHKQLTDLKYKMVFLRSETLCRYMDHLNHATVVLNPELANRESTVTKGRKRIEKALQALNADSILEDASLDV